MHVSDPKTRPLTLVVFLRRVVYYSKHIDDGGIIIERAFQRIRKRK
jgi:hypothetical protein